MSISSVLLQLLEPVSFPENSLEFTEPGGTKAVSRKKLVGFIVFSIMSILDIEHFAAVDVSGKNELTFKYSFLLGILFNSL